MPSQCLPDMAFQRSLLLITDLSFHQQNFQTLMSLTTQQVALIFHKAMEKQWTVKGPLRKAEDPYLALLAYWNTHLQIGFSPTQLLMSTCRRLHSTVPML